MENNNNSNELEQMREQLSVLKKKLNRQEIVNDRLMRESMKSKMSWIRKYLWICVILAPLLIVYIAAMASYFGLSVWFVVFTAVMFIASIAAQWYVNGLDKNAFSKDNLTKTARHLLKMKQQRARLEMIELPILLVWIAWLIGGLYSVDDQQRPEAVTEAAWGGIIGGCLGAVIGLFTAFFLYRKMQKTNDEVIHQINELMQE